MARQKIPEKVWEMVRRDWANGVPVKTLADVYGMSEQTVWNRKTKEQWDLPITQVKASIQEAKEAAEGRVIAVIEETEQSMRGVLERHKGISHRIAGLLDQTVTRIEEMANDPEVAPQKVLQALKVAGDVASNLQKNERRSWGMDEKQGASSLEDFLDKQEGKLSVINGGK